MQMDMVSERKQVAAMTLEEMKKRKAQKGYTIEQISKYSGVSLGTLQKIFAGITKAPRYETRVAIERVLEMEDCVQNEMHKQADFVKEPIAYATELNHKQGTYTVEDYYKMSEERRMELIDGVIYDMSSPTFVHQSISQVIMSQIQAQIRKNKGKCKLLHAPVDVRLDADDKTIVQPDIIILCDQKKIRKWGVMGAPDFVLEIVSDSTRKNDYFKKMIKYMDAGVKEYWIVDPKRKILTVYNFTTQEGPSIFPLEGKAGIGIYQNEIQIDLDEVAAEILEYPEE